MKPLLFFSALLLLLFKAQSQNVGIGTATPTTILDIVSTSQGVLFPRLTTFQMNAIANPANGLMITNTDSANRLFIYTGAVWKGLSFANEGIIADTALYVHKTVDETIVGTKTFNGHVDLNNTVSQIYTGLSTDANHDGFFSQFSSDFAGYNYHAVRIGAGIGGAIGGANASTGEGDALVGNRRGTGNGSGGKFLRLESGIGDGVNATQAGNGNGAGVAGLRSGSGIGPGVYAEQYGTGPGDGVNAIRSNSGNGNGITSTHSGSGTGDGLNVLKSSSTTGNAITATISGGSSGDVIKATTNGTGYTGKFLYGKGVRIEHNPVANDTLFNSFVLGSYYGTNDAYSLQFGDYWADNLISHRITNYYSSTPMQFIDFKDNRSLDMGFGRVKFMSLKSNGRLIFGDTTDNNNGKIQVTGSVIADSFKIRSGLSSQLLQGDGGTVLKSTFAASSHTHTFAELNSKPTTVSGYGISDALTAANFVTEERVTGIANGSNVTFATAHTPVTQTTRLYNNKGVRLFNGIDYIISGTTITMTEAPLAGTTLFIDYIFI